MEPKILLIGRSLDTLEILKSELVKFDRDIVYANSEELIESNLKDHTIDIIVVGAGLPDEIKEVLLAFIKKNAAGIPLHVMERTPGINPTSMIGYTNEKAVMWRLMGGKHKS